MSFPRLRAASALAAALSIAVSLSALPAAEGSAGRTWYVSASAKPGGNGSAAKPFGSLLAVESASRAGDTIRVLPSDRTLDGGIRLKPGQAARRLR